MKKFTFIAAALLSGISIAQEHDHAHFGPTNPYQFALDQLDPLHQHVCGFNVEQEVLFNENPALRIQHDQEKLAQEARYQNFLQNEFDPNARSTYIIPVVFHVVHEGGSENISDEQIYDALNHLNMDFNMNHPDVANTVAAFTGIVGNVDIEFRIATKDPNQNCHKGITRTYVLGGGDHDTGDNVDIRNAVAAEHGTWPQNKYMNVFIVKNINGSAAYTNKPGNWYSPNGMGGSIYTRHSYMGSIGTGSPSVVHTLAHEVGHWLNLSHCWGNNNSAGDAASCGTDDDVTDTPNTIGWLGGCVLDGETCGSLDNVQNIMDYGSCRTMFTQGQVARMQFALQPGEPAQRSNLWQTSNLNATGVNGPGDVCEAIFSSDVRVICAGSTVNFTDESYHSVTSRSWSFSGGTPSTSTVEQPAVVYNTPGIYSVSLNVSDGSNTEMTTENNYIIVLEETGEALPYSEGFEYVTGVPDNENWMIENFAEDQAWTLTSAAGSGGTSHSAMLQNYYTSNGSVDELISGTIDLSTVDAADQMIMSFEYAYRKTSSTTDEKLKVYVSNDCGENWVLRKQITGDNLSTEISNSNYVPSTVEEWYYVELTNINSPYYVEGFRYKFEFTGDGGNNIYIDNINLYPVSMTSIDEQSKNNALTVFPNPTNGQTNIQMYGEEGIEYLITIHSALGQQIDLIHQGTVNTGLNNFEYNTSELAKGLYIIRIESEGLVSTVKLVKE